MNTHSPTDAETVRSESDIMRDAQRDPAQFAPLYEAYFPRIYSYCRRRTNSDQEAEDLTSTVFIRALRGVHTYQGGNVAAWLFRIAHNAVISYRRKQRPQVSIEAHDLEFIADTAHPSESITSQEERQLLNHLFNELTDEQQNLLSLKLNGQLTSSQIGDVLGKSASAVRVEVHRLIKYLRMLYHKEVQSESRG